MSMSRWSSVILAAVTSACSGAAASSPTPATPTAAPPPRPALAVVTTEVPSRDPLRAAWLDVYTIEPDGRLVSAGPRQSLPPLHDPAAVVFDEHRHFLHVLDRDLPAPLSLTTYQVGSTTGTATRLGTTNLPRAWHRAALHPSGRFLYGAASDARQQIDGIEIDPRNGAVLGSIPGAPFGWETSAGLGRFDMSPSGRFLYAHGTRFYKSQVLLSFAVDQRTGALAVSSESPVTDRLSNLLVDPQERFAYLIQPSAGRISGWAWRGFAIHPGDGSLLELPNSPWHGTYANAMRYSASGRWVLSEGGWNGASNDLASLRENDQGVFETSGGAPLPREALDIESVLQEGATVVASSERTVTSFRFDDTTGGLATAQTLLSGERARFLAVGILREPSSAARRTRASRTAGDRRAAASPAGRARGRLRNRRTGPSAS